MKQCRFCGTSQPEEVQFCSKCGAVFSDLNPSGSVDTRELVFTAQAEEAIVTEASAVRSRKASPKPKNLLKWLIPVGAVAAVAVAAACLWQPVLKAAAPQTYVGVMMNNTSSAVEKRLDGTPIGLLNNNAYFENGSVGVGIDLSQEAIGDLSAGLTIHSNVEKQQWQMDLEASLADVDMDLSAYMDGDVFALGSDAFCDGKYYGLTYKSFENDIRTSAFGEALDKETLDVLTSVVESVDSGLEWAANIDEKLEPYTEVLEAYIKDLKSINGSEEIDLGDKQYNCSTVAFVIDQEELFDMLDELIEVMEEDPDYEDLLEEFPEMDIIDDLKSAVSEANKSFDADAVLTYYVYNSKVVDIKLDMEISAEGETVELELDICYGANPKKDDIVITCNMKSNGERVSIKVIYSDAWEGDSFESDISLVVRMNGEKQGELSQTTKWNKDSGKLKIGFEMDETKFECSMKLLEKKNGCEIYIDDLLEFMGEIDEGLIADAPDFTCSIRITLAEGTSISRPDFVNLDKLDQETLEEISNDVQSFLEKNKDAFSGLTGGSPVPASFPYNG